ncbi:MAG: hypothetical protein IT290_10765 [Deltaproteobacteria bacterium]|nr:hypothetical protein [Deltaproteobacteria bacterium]
MKYFKGVFVFFALIGIASPTAATMQSKPAAKEQVLTVVVAPGKVPAPEGKRCVVGSVMKGDAKVAEARFCGSANLAIFRDLKGGDRATLTATPAGRLLYDVTKAELPKK